MDNLPAKPEIDILNLAGAEWAARIEWAKDQIAESNFTPRPPPKPWAGRDNMMAAVASEFSIPLIEAAGVIDAACSELTDDESVDGPTAERRTMLYRLRRMRKKIAEGIEQGIREMTFKYEEIEEIRDGGKVKTGKVKKVPFKEKVIQGINMAAVGRYLECERQIADLLGIGGADDAAGTFSIYEELEEKIDETKRKKGVSLSQKIKSGPVLIASDEGLRMLDAAVKEAKKAKQVESKEVEPEEPDDDGDDETEE